MSEMLEIIMIVNFGFSWPINALKAYRARSAKGQSLWFLLLIEVGYICGIAAKLLSDSFKWYVLFFYILNFCVVGVNLLIYFRNVKLDKQREKELPSEEAAE